MGRKRRKPKGKRGKAAKRRAEEKHAKRVRPSHIRMVLWVLALVIVIILAVLIFKINAPDDDGNGNGNGNGNGPVVNKPPVAKAKATPAEVFTFENVTFDGSASYDTDGRVVNFTWEVHRDWRTGPVIYTYYGRKFNRSYDEPGALWVVLKVRDDDGAENSTVSVNPNAGLTININNRLPVAIIEGDDNITVSVGKEVYLFGDKSHDEDGNITSYEWDFGDGSTATGDNVMHAYESTGPYTITLRVVDDRGDSTTDRITVVVT